jgi:hypothetical protein
MATDNDNVIDIDGSKGSTEHKPEHKEGKEGDKGKEGDGGKKGKQKKVALMVALGVFGLIAAYLAYTYYKNNIAGSSAAATPDAGDDSGSGAGSGGGAPAVPTPLAAPTDTGGQAPIINIILPNGAPAAVAKVKTAEHKVTGHASGPKITTPKTFVKAAQKVVKLASGVKVQKAVATPANLDVTKAIGAEEKDTKTANDEAEANAHGHTANPIVHAVAVPANLDVTKALGTEEKTVAAKATPKAAPSLSKAPALSKPAAPAPKAAPKPAPKVAVGKTRKIA